jgi:transposase
VRESFRTPQGPRSRTICNLTGLPPDLRELITRALRGEPCVAVGQLTLSAALDYGGLAVLVEAWQHLGLEEVLAAIPSVYQRRLLQAMIFSRLLFPCAKLALAEQAQGKALPQACGLAAEEAFDENDLYAAMDELNGRWVQIEKALYRKAFAQGVRLVLYDLSSVYFEGQGPEKLSRYGHSRDHRSDRPQVLLAVATDEQGVPIHLEVLRGNRADTKTLQGLLANLQRRFGIREATFVFDGGMSSRWNLEAMSQAHLRYVTRLSSGTLQKLLSELPEDQQLELADRSRLVEIEQGGKRYVIAGGPWRRQRDQERRQARLAKAEKELARLAAVRRQKLNAQKLVSQVGRTLERLKAHKYFTYEVDAAGQLRWERKADVIHQEEQRDGLFLLHTNQSPAACSKEQTLAQYKGLLEVEEVFGELKSFLEVRPVYHWRPDRVRNHVRICFLAYWLSARLGRQWRQKGEKGEVPRILRALQTIRLGRLEVQGRKLQTVQTQIPPQLNGVLTKLDLLKLFATPPHWAGL